MATGLWIALTAGPPMAETTPSGGTGRVVTLLMYLACFRGECDGWCPPSISAGKMMGFQHYTATIQTPTPTDMGVAALGSTADLADAVDMGGEAVKLRHSRTCILTHPVAMSRDQRGLLGSACPLGGRPSSPFGFTQRGWVRQHVTREGRNLVR